MTHIVVAVDVGGTAIKCALVGRDGSVVHTERHATAGERGPAAVVTTIVEIAEALVGKANAAGFTPRAVGVVIPGVVDEAAGVAVMSANVGFRDVPLRHKVSGHLCLPVAVGHDVRAGGLAEARLGAGRDREHVLFVAAGTGIAAAHLVRGRAQTGAHSAAGELGHVVVRPGGTTCGCGARGCLEAYASAAAIARRYADLVGRSVPAARVAELVAACDETAIDVWGDAVEALADGLVTAQALYDVDTVVLGGGLAEARETLLIPLRSAVRARLTFHREPAIVRAALGDEAGCLGAALLAWDLVAAP